MIELWDHQKEALTALRQSVSQGVFRIMLASPTGSGKTKIAAALIDAAQRKNNRMAFVVSHISLIDQAMESFYAEGIRDVGVIQAQHVNTDWSRPVQLCSIQTLRSKGVFPECKAAIFDEAHVLHDYHRQWLKHPDWQRVPIIGLSATPWASGLGKYFDSLLVVSTTQELIDKGLLSKFKVFAAAHPDLTGVRIVAGDYKENELSDAMQKGTLTADIVDTWKRRWGKDKTFIFAVDCKHAQALQARFLAEGVSCAYQDARTSSLERADIKRKFHSGEYRAIANVGTLTVGVDYDVRCLVMARPTKSEMLYVQIIGRALRTAPGKDHAIILDHSKNTETLGFVTNIHHDYLDDGKAKQKPKLKKPNPKPCPQCDCMLPRVSMVCVNCGFKMEPAVSGLIELDGELVEVSAGERQKRGASRKYTMAEKERWYSGFLFIARERGYKEGWAAQQFKQKFGVWPNSFKFTPASEPSVEIRGYVQSRLIAYAMAKKKHGTIDRRVIDAL